MASVLCQTALGWPSQSLVVAVVVGLVLALHLSHFLPLRRAQPAHPAALRLRAVPCAGLTAITPADVEVDTVVVGDEWRL